MIEVPRDHDRRSGLQHGELISVVVPVFNRAHLIPRSVGSVLAQTYRNLEVLVVDDCSTDDIQGAVAALGDARVRLVRRDRNGGAAAARNSGVSAANGRWIAFHDSDDFCTADRIELCVRKLMSLPADFIGVYGSALFYAAGPEETYAQREVFFLPSPGEPQLSGDLSARTETGNLMNLPTMLVAKAALAAAGPFDERLRQNEDWDMCLRLTRQGKFGFVPDFLILSPNPIDPHRAADKISRSARLGAQSFVRITGKLRKGGARGVDLARHYAAAGRFLMRIGKPRAARRFFRASLALDPGKPKIWAHLALSHVPALHAALRRA